MEPIKSIKTNKKLIKRTTFDPYLKEISALKTVFNYKKDA